MNAPLVVLVRNTLTLSKKAFLFESLLVPDSVLIIITCATYLQC